MIELELQGGSLYVLNPRHIVYVKTYKYVNAGM